MGKELVADEVLTTVRRQHGRITRPRDQVVDAEGDAGWPFVVEGMLGRLERRGDIGADLRAAGEEFSRLFRHALLDPLRAADMGQRIAASGPHYGSGIERARRQINDVLQALGGHGSPCGSCAWFVLGDEMSIADWARREGWAGRPLRPEVAKGTLIGTLGVLAAYFATGIKKNR